jgi:Tfp pilus assembly protein PilO
MRPEESAGSAVIKENLSRIAAYWRKLTKRERMIAAVTTLCILSWLIYQVPYALSVRALTSIETGIRNIEQDLIDQTVQLVELRRRASIDISTSAGWDLADQKSTILFLEDVSGAARRMGVGLVEVHPSREVTKEKYKEISMNLDLKGRYRELGEYFKRLERLPRVVNIRKIRIESCPDASSVCVAQIEAVTYMAK